MQPSDIWGPEPEAFRAYKNQFRVLEQYGSTHGSVANPHYRRVADGLILDSWFLRGVYETKDIDVKTTDIFVASFPKSGTTWLQEIVYAIDSNLDFHGAKSLTLTQRFPFLENAPMESDVPDDPSRSRLIMTHLPYSHLPTNIIKNKPKILYIGRNPKDTLLSMYYFCRIKKKFDFQGDLAEFLESFITDKLVFSPYPRHILEFWAHRNDPNVYFLMYEDLQNDTVNEVKRIAKFLRKPLNDEQAIQVVDHCSFDNMAATSTMNYQDLFNAGVYDASKGSFIRKGKIGDWKNTFDEEMNRRMDSWIEANFGHTDLKFVYE